MSHYETCGNCHQAACMCVGARPDFDKDQYRQLYEMTLRGNAELGAALANERLANERLQRERQRVVAHVAQVVEAAAGMGGAPWPVMEAMLEKLRGELECGEHVAREGK